MVVVVMTDCSYYCQQHRAQQLQYDNWRGGGGSGGGSSCNSSIGGGCACDILTFLRKSTVDIFSLGSGRNSSHACFAPRSWRRFSLKEQTTKH